MDAQEYPSKMNFRGMMAGGTSWNGIEVDVLKSGIQKYIRRGILDKALWCTFELDLFHDMLHREPTTGLKALSTNILNRLVITSVEDIGIGNPILPLMMRDKMKIYLDSRLSSEHSDIRRRSLYDMIYLMSNSRKSRELSHIKCVYYQVPLSDKIDEYATKYPNIYSFDREVPNEYLAFTKAYDHNSDECFYWFLKMFYKTEKASIVQIYIDYVIDNEHHDRKRQVMNILNEWFKTYTFKESILFGMQILLLGLRKVSMSEYVDYVPNPTYPDNKGTIIDIDPYVIDKHTKQGKKEGKNTSLFATEGSIVANEDPMTNTVYKEIYISYRSTDTKHKVATIHRCNAIYKSGKKQGEQCSNAGKIEVGDKYYCMIHNPEKGASKPVNTSTIDIKHKMAMSLIDELHSVVTLRGQLLCGRHKKSVFIPVTGTNVGVIFKGPWRNNDIDRINTILYRQKVLSLLGVRIIPLKVAIGEDNNIYTFCKNIATTSPDTWTYEEKHDKIVGSDVRIVNRESMGIIQVSKLSLSEQKDILFGKRFMFRSLLIANMLKVGDIGTYNILVAGDRAFLVDFEETTTRVTFSSIDHVYCKMSSANRDILLSGIKENRDKISSMLSEVRDKLSDVVTDTRDLPMSMDIMKEWDTVSRVIQEYI